MDNDALKNEFLVESFENLSSINEDLTHLEKDPKNYDLLNKIYRTVHTMKGSASFLGYKKLQDLTHSAENLLDELREQNVQLTPKIVDTILKSFDLCNCILKAIESSNCEGDDDVVVIKNELDYFISTEYKNSSKDAIDELDSLVNPQNVQENSSSFDENLSAAALDSLKELIGDGKMDSSVLSEFEQNIVVPTTEKSQKVELIEEDIITTIDSTEELIVKKDLEAPLFKNISKNSIADSIVRVNVKVLDKIMNIVGELVLNRNQIVQYSNTQNSHDFSKLSQHLDTITTELQSEVMSTRMQPIGSILTKFERLIRDFARNSDKKINLKLSGQETELDKTLIEAIKDPLVHIIRNACDHGIETVEERQVCGKSSSGEITIKAYNESGQVTIEIVDNGRGLDKQKIGFKAIDKGVITQEQFQNMNDQQVYGLIFAPGFSTADRVTSISGRGVGMDVVKTNIEKIGGSVSVNSQLSLGTTFKLRIPLTLAIVPALIIKSFGESFAIPQLNLVELVRLETKDEQILIENIQGSEFLRLRGKLTPVFRLNEKLKLQKINSMNLELKKVVEDNEIYDSRNIESRTENKQSYKENQVENIVIVNAEGVDFGIIVDEILDTEEIVVKPLSSSLKHLNLFGGATIMGDGRVALILDALGFLNTFTSSRDRAKDITKAPVKDKHFEAELADKQESLLFKLGDGRIYAVPLQLVTRLEEFSTNKIERTGDQPIIRYLNSPVPLINIERTLGLGGQSMLDSHKEKKRSEISCIITTIRQKNFGIIVDDILDINIDYIKVDTTAVDREGILGTFFIENKTVSLIDLYAIVKAQGLGIESVTSDEQHNINKSKKILLVDDSSMYRKMESDALLEQGYQVDIANHGEHGYEMFQKTQYDLLITDIEMPVLDGFEFVERVRAESIQKDIPVIALSTRVSQTDKAKGLKCGFNYHLEKFKKDEVVDLVRKVLNGE